MDCRTTPAILEKIVEMQYTPKYRNNNNGL